MRYDFIVPLILNTTTHLYQTGKPYLIPEVVSKSVEIFDEAPTYMIIKQIPKESGLYSTSFIYTVMGNGTSALVMAFTVEWFAAQPGIIPQDYENLNIIDFSVINQELVVLIDSNKRLYIVTFDSPYKGTRKFWKLRKTLHFPEPLLDVFVKTDLAESYLVVKAARSSNLYIISVTTPDNPVLERQYVCWDDSMCSLFTNNLGVTYNQNFVLSVQSDDYNEQSVLTFYKRGFDFSSIPYYRIDMASLRPDEIFVEFLDYRSNYFVMKARNEIKIFEMFPHTIQFVAWPNNTIPATISFNVTSFIAQKEEEYSVTQNLTVYLSPHNNTHSFASYNSSELIVLQDSALQFNLNPLFIGSNLTLSFLANYEQDGEQYSQMFDQEPMLTQSKIYDSTFAKDCKIYRLERGYDYSTTNITYEVCFNPHSLVYQRNFKEDTRNELHFGTHEELIFRDVIWLQDLNAYIILCTFNSTSFTVDPDSQYPEILNSTLALYYNIEVQEIIYFSSQFLFGFKVRQNGAFYDEFSKVLYLVDQKTQNILSLYRFLGCPLMRQDPTFLEQYKTISIENGSDIQSIGFTDNFSALIQTENYRFVFDSRIENTTLALVTHHTFMRDKDVEFGELFFTNQIIIFQRNNTIRGFRLKDFNIWDDVELPLPPGFDYFLIQGLPQYHRFFNDFILLLERKADKALFMAEYDLSSDLQGAVRTFYPIDGSYFKNGQNLKISTIEFTSTKKVMLSTASQTSQVTIFNNFKIKLDSCEIQKLKQARIVEKKSHMEVYLHVRKLNTTYNGLHVSLVDYPSSNYASPLTYTQPQSLNCEENNDDSLIQTNNNSPCRKQHGRKLSMSTLTLTNEVVSEFVLENYFQGFSLQFQPDNYSSPQLAEAVQISRHFKEMSISLNVSTTDRNLLAHIFFRKNFMFTYDSLSALSLYDVTELEIPIYLTETYLGGKGSKYDIIYAGYCIELETMIMIFIGNEAGASKQIKTVRLLAQIDQHGQPNIISTNATSIALTFAGSHHATFCFCKGAEYTIVIEQNKYDDYNKAIHIYEPVEYNKEELQQVIVLDATYFRLSSFNATYISVHKHFPVLLVALAQYGVIGIDLATFQILLDADFSEILQPSPTLPSYQLLSLVDYGDTNLIVSVQNLGTVILDIPKLNTEFYITFVNAQIDMVPGSSKPLNKSDVGYHLLPSYNLLSPTKQFIASDYYGVVLTHNSFDYQYEVTIFDFMAHRRSRINTSFRVASNQKVTNRCYNMASRWGSANWQYQLPLHTTKFSVLCDNQIFVYELDMFHTLNITAANLPASKDLSFDLTAITLYSESSATIHFQVNRLSGPLSLSTVSLCISFLIILVFFIVLMLYCRSQKRQRILFNYKPASLQSGRDLSWRSDLESEYDLEIYDTSKVLSPSSYTRRVSGMRTSEKTPILRSQGSVDSDLKSESSHNLIFGHKKELHVVRDYHRPFTDHSLRRLAEQYGCTEVQRQLEKRKRIESGNLSEAE